MERGFEMPLNEWNQMFFDIYNPKNTVRGPYPLLIHVVEVYSALGTGFAKSPANFAAVKELIPKCLAWYCGLARQLRIADIEEILWSKYPGVCPYCRQKVCNCPEVHEKLDDIAVLKMAKESASQMPQTVNDWLRMFGNIYAARNTRLQPPQLLAKVLEELGELAEALRIEPYLRRNLLNEMADALSWFFAVVNYLNSSMFKGEAINLARLCWDTYPDICSTCRRKPCACPEDYVSKRISEAGPFVGVAALLDTLLPIYSRKKLDQDLPEITRRAKQESDTFSLVLIDIDDFKKVNDEFGHPIGDAVLLEVSDRIRRESLGKGDVYRYGGEEILVLMKGFSADEAKGTAERIRKKIAGQKIAHPEKSDVQIPVTISAGIAEYPGHGVEAAQLLKAADNALYAAKKAGKNQAIISD